MSELHIAVDHRDARDFHLQLDASLELRGVTALFGPSGSGKTSLLDLTAGLRPDIENASIRLGDRVWQEGRQRLPAEARNIAYVFQDARLFPHLNVAANLAFASRRAKASQLREEQVVAWLDIASLLDQSPDALSAGQKQRVAIARALLRNPELLLLDEPLANLDRGAAEQIMARLIQVANETQIPMIYVSHQIEEVSAIADRILILEDGKLAARGSMLELASRLDTRLADDESAAAILTVAIGGRDEGYGLSELRVDGECLWVSAQRISGDQRRLRIPARDVSICRERPTATSILNILPVTVVDLRDVGSAHCLVRLRLREQHLLARITRRSRDELALAVGEAVFAQIKSTALLGDSGS